MFMTDFSSTGKRAGLAIIATGGLMSAVSTFILMCYIMYCMAPGARKSPLTIGVRKFARSALGKYLIALLISDFIQGAAFAINYRWAALGSIHEGTAVCIAQASVSQFGDLGTALFTLAITFHTFWLLFLQRKPAEWVCHLTLVAFGLFGIIMPVVGSHVIPHATSRGEFWGSSGAWCWIGEGYQLERFMYVYLWIFMNLICSVIVYCLIYLKFVGIIDYMSMGQHGSRFVFYGWRITRPIRSTSRGGSSSGDSRGNANHISQSLGRIARRLAWYPMLYALVVVPISVIRLGGLAGWHAPFGMYVFAGFCFSSSGLTNALLFVFTRHSFIQRITRPPGIHITTHQLTVIEAANNTDPKSFALRELQSRMDPRHTDGSDAIAVRFTADVTVDKQPEFSGNDEVHDESDAPMENSKIRHPYGWAHTP